MFAPGRPEFSAMPETAKIYASSQIVRYSRMLDSYRRRVTDDPTPAKMAALLNNVENGDIAALTELQEEMEAKDGRIQAVANTRRMALTALEWEIEPARETLLAKMAADYIRERLEEVETWPTTLEHLATAIGPNVAVFEMVFDNRATLVATVDVPGHRLTTGNYNEPGIRIQVDEDVEGIAAWPGKFVVYYPNSNSGFPFRRTLTHAAVVPFLMKHFSRADWMAFSEIYGVPWRWATREDSAGDDDTDTIQEMLDNLSSDAAAVLPAGIKLNTLELGNRSGDTFKNQLDWADTTLAILFLGQSLTTEIGDRGSFAAAKVHDNVRTDLLLSDIAKEARVIREQMFRPMLRYKFPGLDMPVPYFKRQLFSKRDTDSERLDLDKIRLARELGLPIEVDEAYEKLGFTKPRDLQMQTIGGASVGQ